MSSQKYDVHGSGISKGYDTTTAHNFREMLGPRYTLGSMTYWYHEMLGRLLSQTKHDVPVPTTVTSPFDFVFAKSSKGRPISSKGYDTTTVQNL